MTIKCEHCNTINLGSQSFCDYCDNLLYSATYTITRLIKTQEKLEKKHQLEFKLLKDELKKVEDYILKYQPPENKSYENTINQEEESVILPPPPAKINTVDSDRDEESELVGEYIISESPHANRKEYKPGVTHTVREESVLNKRINQLFEPLVDGYDLIKEVIGRYKREGKLPILLMTIAGILAILVGFGHLMQLSFDYLGVYSGIVKISLGFISSIVIGLIGKRLYKRDSKYEEYSSALLSLMIVLNYLLIYFLTNLSNFPIISSAKIGFLLIVANTGLSIFLAFKYETKIIAVLSLIGGALTPFYLNESGNLDYYFGYLWILLMASNFIALHIKWYKLNYISFVLFLVLVESAVFTGASESNLFIGYLHLFAYLFFYIVLFDKTTLKSNLSQSDLIILCGNLTALLFNLYNTLESYLWLGVLYIINGLVFVFFLIRSWKTIPMQMKIGLFITIGSFIGLAIPFLFGQALVGLFWSIEAILLIVMGFVYVMPSIRKEGYIILLIALGKLFISAFTIIDDWGGPLVNEGFLNYIVLGVIFSVLWYIGIHFKDSFSELEKKIYSVFKEIIPFWLSSILFIVGYSLIGNFAFNIMILPLFGLIYWHYTFKTKSTEIIGLLHLVIIGAAFKISVDTVGSSSFSDQLLFGKLAILELLFTFWFLQFFYEKMGYDTLVKHKVVRGLRILFYVLLPLLFIKQVFKHYTPYFPLSLWVGVLMSYGLFKKFKHHALLIESHILIFLAIGINIGLYGLGGISVGLVALTLLLILENAFDKVKLESSKFHTLLLLIPYIIIGLIGVILFMEKIDILLILFIIMTILFLYLHVFNRFEIVYNTYKIGFKIGLLFTLITGIVYFLNSPGGFEFISLLLLVVSSGYLLYFTQSDYKENNKLLSWYINVFIHQILIIFTYLLSIKAMNLDLDGPLSTIFIVIHAIVLLFVALRVQNKALNKGSLIMFIFALIKVVFHDIRDFAGTSKIIVLIMLGVILLMASFGYVKVKNKYMSTEIDNNEDHE